MATNSYFKKGYQNEQKLLDSIISEQIQVTGIDVLYIPRTVITKDELLGENYFSKFDKNFWIEMQLKDAGFQSHGFNTNVYGIIDNELILIVSKSTWSKFANILSSDFQDFSELKNRPREGDLIWIPFLKQIYEIRLVDHESTFYTLEKLYTYSITCELYRFSPEKSELQLEEYKDYSLESGFVRMIKITDYNNGILFKEGELVILQQTGDSGKVVQFDRENKELYLSETSGDFLSGILEGKESGAVAEIYQEQSKKRRPKKARMDNKKVEEIADLFFNDIENPFLR